MAKTDSARLILDVRRESKQKALQEALLVPWHLDYAHGEHSEHGPRSVDVTQR